jgi:trans-aconitate 2-methyltransferase
VTNATTIQWNAGLYDSKHDFVFKYGEDLVEVLAPKKGEHILDLGCGTGYLTSLIAETGAYVKGIDNSAEMISKAKKEYPDLDFEEMSATEYKARQPFDAVFSNAVLHWIPEKEKTVRQIYSNLKNKGRLVLEMGGKKNIDSIISALKKTLLQHGFAANAGLQVWYFPSLSEYAALLEENGLVVHYAAYYKRETELKDDRNGIKDWIKMFGTEFLKGIDSKTADKLLDEVQEMLRPTNFRNNKWYADYQRLRIVAVKE